MCSTLRDCCARAERAHIRVGLRNGTGCSDDGVASGRLGHHPRSRHARLIGPKGGRKRTPTGPPGVDRDDPVGRRLPRSRPPRRLRGDACHPRRRRPARRPANRPDVPHAGVSGHRAVPQRRRDAERRRVADLARRRRRATRPGRRCTAGIGPHIAESLRDRPMSGGVSGGWPRLRPLQRPVSGRVAGEAGFRRRPAGAGRVQRARGNRPARPFRPHIGLRPLVQPRRTRRLVPAVVPAAARARCVRRAGHRDLHLSEADRLALLRSGQGGDAAPCGAPAVRLRSRDAARGSARPDGQPRDRVPRVRARGARSDLSRCRVPPARTTAPTRRSRGCWPGAGPAHGRRRTDRPTARPRARSGGRRAG